MYLFTSKRRPQTTLESSSLAIRKVYGHKSWVILQRMTVPLVIFLRFHAFVLCIELDKEYTNGGGGHMIPGDHQQGFSNWELRSAGGGGTQDIRMSY